MNHMENLSSAMEEIGLSEKEARVYLALLRTGQASASLVATNSGLKRPTTYLVLEDLRKRGFVLKMPSRKKQMFLAKSPEEIITQAKRSVDRVFQVLPQLMNMYAKSASEVRTIHFEGINGLREAYRYKLDVLKGTEILGFFGSTEDASADLLHVFHEWNKSIAEHGIKLRSVVPSSESLNKFRESDKKYGFKPKILSPDAYTSKTSIEVADQFIRIVMFKEQQAVIIENPVVAKAMREIFEMIYSK